MPGNGRSPPLAPRRIWPVQANLIEQVRQLLYPIDSNHQARTCAHGKKPVNGVLEDFRIEFLECWQRMPNKGLFLILLAAWLALFQFLGNSTLGYIPTPSLFTWMHTAYASNPDANGSDDSHGKLIPFVVLGLFWWKRKQLLALPLRTWWPGLLLVALALGLHVVGYMVQQPRISIMALFVGIYGLMGLAWGPEWLRESFFPFFLFAFCVPLGWSAVSITFPLRLLVCRVVEVISGYVLQIDILREGTALMDPTGHYQYDVAAACSGIRSLFATSPWRLSTPCWAFAAGGSAGC